MKKIILFAVLSASLLLSACSSYSNKSPMPTIDKNTSKILDSTVDCRNASRNVKILEEEKASVGKQALSGVRSIMPISVVAGLLMGDYSDRVSVATGQYNSDINAKIVQIKRVCGVR